MYGHISLNWLIAITFVSFVGGLFQIIGWSTFVGSGHGD